MLTIRMSEEDFRDECNSYGGVCLDCGARTTGVEPDARRYRCERCGREAVYGLEEALLMGQIVFAETDPDADQA